MKKSANFIPFIFSFLISITFAPAGPIEKATELMKLMEIRKNIDQMEGQMEGFMNQTIDSQGLTEEKAKKAKSLASQSMKVSFESMKKIEWETMFAEIYGSVFSEEELEGLINFYSSPTGKKFLEKQPQLMTATVQKMQAEMVKIIPTIQEEMKKAIEEAKK